MDSERDETLNTHTFGTKVNPTTTCANLDQVPAHRKVHGDLPRRRSHRRSCRQQAEVAFGTLDRPLGVRGDGEFVAVLSDEVEEFALELLRGPFDGDLHGAPSGCGGLRGGGVHLGIFARGGQPSALSADPQADQQGVGERPDGGGVAGLLAGVSRMTSTPASPISAAWLRRSSVVMLPGFFQVWSYGSTIRSGGSPTWRGSSADAFPAVSFPCSAGGQSRECEALETRSWERCRRAARACRVPTAWRRCRRARAPSRGPSSFTLGLDRFPAARDGLNKIHGERIADLVEANPHLDTAEAAERLGYPRITHRGATAAADAELRTREAHPCSAKTAGTLAEAGLAESSEVQVRTVGGAHLTAAILFSPGQPAVALVWDDRYGWRTGTSRRHPIGKHTACLHFIRVATFADVLRC